MPRCCVEQACPWTRLFPATQRAAAGQAGSQGRSRVCLCPPRMVCGARQQGRGRASHPPVFPSHVSRGLFSSEGQSEG